MFRKGFTLIELMIVVAILGILAAVAVPAFLKYIRDSKTAEAEENLKSIGDGALAFYQEEHPVPASLEVFTREYPSGQATPDGSANYAVPVETVGGAVEGAKSDPTAEDWTDPTWKALRFTLSKPFYYKYTYTAADAKNFEATADAMLDSDTVDSQFNLVGETNPNNDDPVLNPIRELL